MRSIVAFILGFLTPIIFFLIMSFCHVSMTTVNNDRTQLPTLAGPVLCDGRLLKGMTSGQLQACQRALSDEFNRRLTRMLAPAISATPSPTPTR